MFILALNSPQLLRENRLKLHFFFFFLNTNFSKYPRAEWIKLKHCFGQKVKT